jgi:two-component system nitrogen regulation response regulator GlnG
VARQRARAANFIYRLALARARGPDRCRHARPAADRGGPRRRTGRTAAEPVGSGGRLAERHRPPAGRVYDEALAAFERPLFVEALRQTGGNQLRAAQLLGINRNTLRKRLSDLAIDPDELQRV